MPQGKHQFESRKNRERKKKSSFIFAIPLFVILVAIAAVLIVRPFDKKEVTTVKPEKATPVISSVSSSASSTVINPTANWIKTANKPNELAILMFHYVDKPENNLSPTWSSNYMAPETLEALCQMLDQNGYTTLTAEQAVKVLTSNLKPSNKMVWLTFDDGHENNYQLAYPILKKYKIHATFNMVTGTLPSYSGTDTTYITQVQMQEMSDSGLISFESHTVSHPDLSTLSEADQSLQLRESKKTLDADLKQNTDVICYPSGKVADLTEKLAGQLGYKIGLLEGERVATGQINPSGFFSVPRFRMSTEEDSQTLLNTLTPIDAYNAQNTAK